MSSLQLKGCISIKEFTDVMAQFANLSTHDACIVRQLCKELHALFDTAHDGRLSFHELMTALVILCGGSSPEAKAALTFNFFVSLLVSVSQ